MTLRSTYLGLALAVALVLVFAAGQTARAWKIENSGANSDGTPKFVDPDEQVKNFGRSGSGSANGSGLQYNFGVQSSDQARNPWRNPATRPLSPDSFNSGNYRD